MTCLPSLSIALMLFATIIRSRDLILIWVTIIVIVLIMIMMLLVIILKIVTVWHQYRMPKIRPRALKTTALGLLNNVVSVKNVVISVE